MKMKTLTKGGAAMVVLVAMVWQSADRATACDPWPATMVLMRQVVPADEAAYARGELGVVKPTYARRFLVQAYRRFIGIAPPGADPNDLPAPADHSQPGPIEAWLGARGAVPGVSSQGASSPGLWNVWKDADDHDYFLNCLDESFRTATRTLETRVRDFGRSNPAILDWVVAQDDVFRNCGNGLPDVVPAAAPAGSPEIFHKDRDYQIAAARFYAKQYADAEQRFNAIAKDASSPWQPYGAYMAARAVARRASLSPKGPERTALFQRADRQFAAVALSQSPLSRSAMDLQHFVRVQANPIGRLHDAASALATSATARDQDFVDYSRLFDRLVDLKTTYSYDAVRARAALIRDDDLTDWILALQGSGRNADARTLERWTATHSVPWLVAALWSTGPADARMDALLADAARIERDSPAYATVSFLRVRTLMARNDVSGARAILATLPDDAGPGFPTDAINLLRAARLRLAQTFEETQRTAPRMPVAEIWSDSVDDLEQHPRYTNPVFDSDGARVFSEGLPLSRLLEAASGSRLPERLRAFVAAAAWTRAVQLRDDRSGLAAAAQLTTLVPALADDMRRYTSASDAETRHRAGLLTLLNWPTLRNYVQQTEDIWSYRGKWPAREIEGGVPQNWWCGFERNTHFKLRGPYEERPSTFLSLLFEPPVPDPVPGYLTVDERAALQSEIARLTALGTAPNYFATEALAWAAATPKDPDAAQALALAVRSTRFGCGNDATGDLSHRAFTALHKQFPNSSWAKQTPYWFKGWGR